MINKTSRGLAAGFAALALALAAGLAGCSAGGNTATGTNTDKGSTSQEASTDTASFKALQKFVDASQDGIKSVAEASAGTYSKVAIEAEAPGTLVYEYYFATAQDAAAMKVEMDKQADSFGQVVTDTVLPAMKTAGVTDSPAVKYVFFNEDGSEIWSQVYDK